jgi:hypothetical protein
MQIYVIVLYIYYDKADKTDIVSAIEIHDSSLDDIKRSQSFSQQNDLIKMIDFEDLILNRNLQDGFVELESSRPLGECKLNCVSAFLN